MAPGSQHKTGPVSDGPVATLTSDPRLPPDLTDFDPKIQKLVKGQL